MTPLIEVARQIVAHELAEPQKQHPADALHYGRWDKWARECDALGVHAPALASAFIESQEALKEAVKLLEGVRDHLDGIIDRSNGNNFTRARHRDIEAFLSKHKDKDNG